MMRSVDRLFICLLTFNAVAMAVGGHIPFASFDRIRYDYTGFVSVKDFGAKGDGVNNDFHAINRAINSASKIYFPEGKYIYKRPDGILESDQNYKGMVFNKNGSTVRLNRSTLMMGDDVGINIAASNVTIDLENGVIDGGARYAYISSLTTASGRVLGERQFEVNVKDASVFKVGDFLTCGFTLIDPENSASEYKTFEQEPLSKLARIIEIIGNTIVVEFPTTEFPKLPASFVGKTLNRILPEDLIIGVFDWGSLINHYEGAMNFVLKNGGIRNARGLFYHTEAGESQRSSLIEGIRFENSGRDPFSLENINAAFKDCYFGKVMEVGKSSFHVASKVDLTITGCVFARGNQDYEIRIASRDGTGSYKDVKLKVANTVFEGYNYYMKQFKRKMDSLGYRIKYGDNSYSPIAIFATTEPSYISSIAIEGSKFYRYHWSLILLTSFDNDSANSLEIGSVSVKNSTLDNITLLYSDKSQKTDGLVKIGAFDIRGASLTRLNSDPIENFVDLAIPMFNYPLKTGFTCSNSSFNLCTNGANRDLPPNSSTTCQITLSDNCPR